MTGFRLNHGGLIDRGTPLDFTFDGQVYTGVAGDTLASALIASDVHLMGRSFKYHRPRGAITAGAAEPNALVELRTGGRKEANTRATMIELYDGLEAKSQNRWPSLKFDIGAINSLASHFFVAGFYYKTFMWPKSFWEKIYEPLIRNAAGLGSASKDADPDLYEKAYAHCDLLVVGSGPAGLMAALTGARSGARVVLADEHAMLGGSLLWENEEVGDQSGCEWAQTIIGELTSMPNVTMMPRTTIFGWFDGNTFGAVERVNDHVAVPPTHQPRQRYWRIFAKKAVLAAGAEERPIVFGGNDVPGVMTASAMRKYAGQYGVAAGSNVVVFANNDSAYRTARDLKSNGVHVEAILDTRAASHADAAGIPVVRGGYITDVKGGKRVSGVTLDSDTSGSFTLGTIPCDAVAMSGGWSPIVNLMCHRGAKPRWSEEIAAFVPPDVGEHFVAAGTAAGHMLLSECLRDGAVAGTLKGRVPKVPKCRDESFAIAPF